jgi:hypothetical protein
VANQLTELSANVLQKNSRIGAVGSTKNHMELDHQIRKNLHQTAIALRKGLLKANKAFDR